MSIAKEGKLLCFHSCPGIQLFAPWLLPAQLARFPLEDAAVVVLPSHFYPTLFTTLPGHYHLKFMVYHF